MSYWQMKISPYLAVFAMLLLGNRIKILAWILLIQSADKDMKKRKNRKKEINHDYPDAESAQRPQPYDR